VKLYLDEDISPRVAQALRQQGRDAISSHEVGNDGLPDEAQLHYAAQHERHLVTYNRRDYLILADRWYRAGKRFPKILFLTESRCPRSSFSSQVTALESYLEHAVGDPNTHDCVDYP